jgi:hypothetical protein
MTKSSLPPRKVRCFVFVRRAAGDDDDGRAEGRRLPTAPWPRWTASTTADPSYLLASSPPAASPRSCTARTAVRDDPVFRCPGKRRSAVPCRAHWPLPTATSTDQITVSPSPPRLAGRWAYVYVRARSAGAAVRAGTRRGGRPGRPPPRRCHRAASATTARSPPGAPCPARAEPGMGRLAPWLPAFNGAQQRSNPAAEKRLRARGTARLLYSGRRRLGAHDNHSGRGMDAAWARGVRCIRRRAVGRAARSARRRPCARGAW